MDDPQHSPETSQLGQSRTITPIDSISPPPPSAQPSSPKTPNKRKLPDPLIPPPIPAPIIKPLALPAPSSNSRFGLPHQPPSKRPRHHPSARLMQGPSKLLISYPSKSLIPSGSVATIGPSKSYNRPTSLPPPINLASKKRRRKDDENLPSKHPSRPFLNRKSYSTTSRPALRKHAKQDHSNNKPSLDNPSAQQPFLSLLPENHAFVAPPVLLNTRPIFSSSDNVNKNPVLHSSSLPAVYRSRPPHEFSLPSTPTPVYVQLIARHSLDLPRFMTGPSTTSPCSKSSSSLHYHHIRPTSKRGFQQFSEASLANRLVVINSTHPPEINLPAWIPPITRSSMAELEFVQVLKNAQLRHDIVFDDVLRFRPNLDGDWGERKRLVADRYWISISRELEFNCRCTAFLHYHLSHQQQPRFLTRDHSQYQPMITSTSPDPRKRLSCICSGGQQHSLSSAAQKPGTIPTSRIPSRIPPLVEELRNILLSLVSPRSPTLQHPTSTAHELICSTLDPIEISSRLESNSKIDMGGLARFLGAVLKGHCAPMRDPIVDGMVGLVSGEQKEFVVMGENGDVASTTTTANATANDSLMKRCYTGLAGGLRMAFELLELMKLDIANHQLRTLRPLLLETALEFEIRHFRDQLLKKPSIERTKRWYSHAYNRVHSLNKFSEQENASTTTSAEVISMVVRDGLLELVFNPPPPPQPQYSSSRWPPSLSLLSAPAPAPAPSCIPETLSMDTARLQTLHSDLTDLTLGYMLLMLFKQLAGHSRLREGEVLALKNELWVLLSDPCLKFNIDNSSGTYNSEKRLSAPGPGVAKFEVATWRAAFDDVILHVAKRVEMVKERDRSTGVPDPELVRKCRAWMDCHVRAGSAFFAVARDRLRAVVEGVIIQTLEAECIATTTASTNTTAVGGMSGSGSGPGGMSVGKAPCVIRTGRATMIRSEEMNRRSTIEEASHLPHTTKTCPSSVTDIDRRGGEIWKRNGMVELEGEVWVVAGRLSKLLKYHLKGYGGLYAHLSTTSNTTTVAAATVVPSSTTCSSSSPFSSNAA